jgi:hypothetical protein
MNWDKGLALMAVVAFSTSCAPAAGTAPTPLTADAVRQAQARDPSLTAESLERGRQLFLTKCNHCHKYPDRTRYTEDQFRHIIPRMAGRSNLSPADGALVLNFILADRAATLAGGTSASGVQPSR